MILNESSLFNDDENVNKKNYVRDVNDEYIHKKIIFNIIWIINHDVILNIFWLRHYNFVINWTNFFFKKLIKFEKCNCVITIQFKYRQRSIINEK